MSNVMWDLMQACWEPRPSARPSAGGICRRLANVVQAPTEIPSSSDSRLDVIRRAVAVAAAGGSHVRDVQVVFKLLPRLDEVPLHF